jgi:FkbM family methyltransferase
MLDAEQWAIFKTKAKASGTLIEEAIKDFYTSLLSPSDNALDGGSHSGYHTLPLAQHLTSGKVIAVDANRTMIDKLTPKLAGFGNVTLEYAALQADPAASTVTFNCSVSHPGRSGISRTWDLIAPGTVDYEPPVVVPATTIDQLADKHRLTSLKFVKLDLEGGEFNALRGASSVMDRLRPVFITEHSMHAPKVNNFTVSDYFDFVEKRGYSVLAPNGEKATRDNPFPFWYVMLAPVERADAAGALFSAAIGKRL